MIEQKIPNLVEQLRVEKICKTENIPIAKFLYKRVKRWLKKPNFPKILSKEILVW